MIGEIANRDGDIEFLGGLPLASGRIALPIDQALVALVHGWRWLKPFEMGDGHWIMVQRGGEALRARR